MSALKQLLIKRAALDGEIEEALKIERKDAIAKSRDLVTNYSLAPSDVFPRFKGSKVKGTVVAPKYRDPVTGKTWSGRGKPPLWIRDKDRSQFVV